jgi:hypothetical protein
LKTMQSETHIFFVGLTDGWSQDYIIIKKNLISWQSHQIYTCSCFQLKLIKAENQVSKSFVVMRIASIGTCTYTYKSNTTYIITQTFLSLSYYSLLIIWQCFWFQTSIKCTRKWRKFKQETGL